MQRIKCEELIGISWQPKSERPFRCKSIQWNEEGGGSEEKREQRDKELKTKKTASIVERIAMGHGMKRHKTYRCSLVNHHAS